MDTITYITSVFKINRNDWINWMNRMIWRKTKTKKNSEVKIQMEKSNKINVYMKGDIILPMEKA